jgi:TLC domain
MPLQATDHLQVPNLDPPARLILRGISILDDCGGWDWNLWMVGVISASLLLFVRWMLQKKGGIEWYALIHALASSGGAIFCLYLDSTSSELLTGTSEPLRAVLCQEPLTSLHRILPAITMGYALFDLYDGIFISVDFIMHGAATLAVMAIFIQVNAPQIMSPFLIMETSTIFLNVTKCDFFTPAMSIANLACFALSFFVTRLVIFPVLWVRLVMTMWEKWDDPVFQTCYPAHFKYTCLLFGLFFIALNAFWFRKIIRKAIRKVKGVERHDEKNNLADESNHNGHNKAKTA